VLLLADVAHNLPWQIIYRDFTLWRARNKERLAAHANSALWALDFSPYTEEQAGRWQVGYAQKLLGYFPFCDFNIPVIPVVHPPTRCVREATSPSGWK